MGAHGCSWGARSACNGTLFGQGVGGVLVGACGVLIQCVIVHCSARGRSFSQGEGGGEWMFVGCSWVLMGCLFGM